MYLAPISPGSKKAHVQILPKQRNPKASRLPTEEDKSRANLFLSYKAITMSPWMTSAQILPRPMSSRNSLAGDAPESNSSENEVSTGSLSALPSGLRRGYLGMPEATGVSVSHSAKLRGTQVE